MWMQVVKHYYVCLEISDNISFIVQHTQNGLALMGSTKSMKYTVSVKRLKLIWMSGGWVSVFISLPLYLCVRVRARAHACATFNIAVDF